MVDHDETICELRRLASEVDRARVASAFVASVVRGPDFWRLPLLALAFAERVPDHTFAQWSSNPNVCAICGGIASSRYDGPPPPGMYGVGYIATMASVLSEARASVSSAPEPTPTEITRFAKLLARVDDLGSKDGPSKLSAAWRRAERALGDTDARELVLQTLAVCGVLETPTHPGLTTRWTDHRERGGLASGERIAPLSLWRAGLGVSRANFEGWFGQLGVQLAPSQPSRVTEALAAHRATLSRRDAEARRSAKRTELEVGDVIAFTTRRGYAAAVVIGPDGGPRPILSFIDWFGVSLPALGELRGRAALGTPNGDRAEYEPVEVFDLRRRIDPAGRWVTIGSGAEEPSSAHLVRRAGFRAAFVADLERILGERGFFDP